MKKHYLSDNEKYSLVTLRDSPNYECNREKFNLSDQDFNMCIRLLIRRGMVRSCTETNEVGFLDCELTEIGMAYLQYNPTLENPQTEEELKVERQKDKRKDYTMQLIIGLIIAVVSFALGYAVK